MKTIINLPLKIIMLSAILCCTVIQLAAQIQPNAVNADPSAKAISQVPLGQNILGTAILRFRFTNEATSANQTGQIPPNSVRLTISFPGAYAFTSVNAIPKFVVEDADTGPAGVVHLVNNAMIDEGEVVDLLLNVRGILSGATGTVTFNADRVTPVIVANTQTANDNASASFLVTGTLPVTVERFIAEGRQCDAKISWTASGEVGIDHYEVEMSNDASARYVTVGNIAANGGDRAQTNYTFNYKMQGNSTHLFRLKIVSIDGSIKYSYIARINSGCAAQNDVILIYPSPARDRVTLNITDRALINTKAMIYDANGKRLSTFVITDNTVNVNISSFSSGVYFVKLTNGQNIKFIKE